jgi:hypothetical protein
MSRFAFAVAAVVAGSPAAARADDRPPSFLNEVVPLLTRAGCNQGACHGKGAGQNGFKLSLRGYAPEQDYRWLTREFDGRRLDPTRPEESLLLRKATAQTPHEGGKLFAAGSREYQLLLSWIRAGFPGPDRSDPKVSKLVLTPDAQVLKPGGQVQLKAVATFADGSTRDVTWLTRFDSNDAAFVDVKPTGEAKALRNGATAVRAMFQTEVAVATFAMPFDRPVDAVRYTARNNFVDDHVFARLKELRIEPSDRCTDREFIRRVFLDACGILPTPEEVQAFAADGDPKKREKLVDALIERPEFVDLWAMKWGEMLRVRSNNQTPAYGRDSKAMFSYAAWIKEQVAKNRPINEMVAELLVGTGSNFKSPPANLYTAGERLTPEKTAEDIAQVFLGTRIQCSQCHNHPFDRWTLDDYYGFAAFFAGVNLKRGGEGREVVVGNNNNANTVAHPVDGRRMKPKFLGGDAPEVDGQDPRKALAKWVTAPENTAFRETMANVIWAHFFGRGITDPVDDVRISNPPSNKELLETLGKKLADYGFDRKMLVRDICLSRTYQLSASTNPTNELDEAYFSHAYVRRLRAEVLLDTITRVTQTEDRFAQSPAGTRAVQIHTGEVTNYFLTTFGRAPRETPCSCEVNRQATLSQALHLVNGDTISQKIAQGKLLPALLAEKKTPEAVIEELYVRTLGRKPTADETAKLADIVRRETTDPERVKEMVRVQLGGDVAYKRTGERIKELKQQLAKLPAGSKEAAQLTKQVQGLEQTQAAAVKRLEANAALMVYGDILWGLFNSTEFAFNH